MKIAFFTEGNYQGKVPRDHSNMRTELAWMCTLNADHYNINQPPNQQYDLGIIIIPKNNPQFDINKLKQYCNKVAVMQEGPNWYCKIIHYSNKYGILILYKKQTLCLFTINQINYIMKD